MTRAALPLLALLVLLVACDGAEPPPHLRVAGGDAQRGRELIAAHGCGACHVVPGLRHARGMVGPPLYDFGARTTLAGHLPNTPSNLIAWLRDPPSIRPQTAMPAVGVTQAEARHMAAYLFSLGAAKADRSVPGPPLEAPAQGAAAAIRQEGRDELGRYRWIDRESGIAAIPIERAMELLAGQDVGPTGGNRP